MTLEHLTDKELEELRTIPKRVVNPKARVANKEGTEQFNYKWDPGRNPPLPALYEAKSARGHGR